MKYILALLVAISFVAAAPERYIIHYDDVAWEALHLRLLPANTQHILEEVKMQIADLDSEEVMMFETIPGVTLHKDTPVTIEFTRPTFLQNNPPSWGLDRIDQRHLPLDTKYHFDSLGSGVDVWVIDTGVRADHKEFGGRATFHKNFAGDDQDTDCNGHGTHVSSTIAGSSVGVAKNAHIHGVKTLNCAGSGMASNTILGINYVIQQHRKTPGAKSVINMSLGGAKSEAKDLAVLAANKAGITVVVAAGNAAEDACKGSPSGAPAAITVAAANVTDESAFFTNFGKCVDIYAPGFGITGAWITNSTEYKTISGTSMASPHVAGAAALILANGLATNPEDVRKHLTETATKDVLKGVPAETPNLLLFVWTD